ncbi:MAG: hypothetical protein IE922_14515 [Sphingomonadales bacterium]|nr:hypothetical protein [Rhodobacterales bacterium]MBD3788152.1 hypothetical protein [Sphingomonadales bacterium]
MTPRESHDPAADAAFDRDLAQLIGAGESDTAMLSRAVLSRLAERPESRFEHLAEVLAAPAPLAAGVSAGLLALVGLGYVVMPLIGGEEMLAVITMRDLMGLGGF